MADTMIAFMKDFEVRFQAASNLLDHRFYSIFYSRIQPAPLMVIGIMPGEPKDGTHQLASQSFYEDWSHEYVDMNYSIAAIMRPALMKALESADVDVLRRVPKTNTFFHRAVGTDEFTAAERAENVRMCAPFLAEIIFRVNPRVIVMEGMAARDNLVSQLATVVQTEHSETLRGMRRGRMNRFFQKDVAFLPTLGREVTLLTLGHPSHFGNLPTWPDAVEALRRNLGHAFQPGKCSEVQRNSVTSATTAPTAVGMQMPCAAHSRQRRATPQTVYEAVRQPPAEFGYQPIHDFWRELNKLGPTSIEDLYLHMIGRGWERPSGKPLTYEVMRIDTVSMAKHGFARCISD